jgi:hypothetical protein
VKDAAAWFCLARDAKRSKGFRYFTCWARRDGPLNPAEEEAPEAAYLGW